MSIINFRTYASKKVPVQKQFPYADRKQSERPTPYSRPFVDEREERFRLAGSIGEAQRLKRTQKYRGIEENREGRRANYYLLGIPESAVKVPDDLARNEIWLEQHTIRTPDRKVLGLKYDKAA